MSTPSAVRLREAALAFAKGAAVELDHDDPEDKTGQRRDRTLRDAAVQYARDLSRPSETRALLGAKLNIALGLRLLLEAADQVDGYTRPGRGIARARQVEAQAAAAEWIRSLPQALTLDDMQRADIKGKR